MKRLLIGLGASATLVLASAGAFACAHTAQLGSTAAQANGMIVLAQAAGTGNGGNTGGDAGGQPDKQTKKLLDPNATESGGTTEGKSNTDPALDTNAESGQGKPEQHTGSGK